MPTTAILHLNSHPLSVVSYGLSVFGFWFSVFGFPLGASTGTRIFLVPGARTGAQELEREPSRHKAKRTSKYISLGGKTLEVPERDPGDHY